MQYRSVAAPQSSARGADLIVDESRTHDELGSRAGDAGRGGAASDSRVGAGSRSLTGEGLEGVGRASEGHGG